MTKLSQQLILFPLKKKTLLKNINKWLTSKQFTGEEFGKVATEEF